MFTMDLRSSIWKPPSAPAWPAIRPIITAGYGKLCPGDEHDQPTFAGHVWLLLDRKGQPLGVYEASAKPATVEITANPSHAQRSHAEAAGKQPGDAITVKSPYHGSRSPDGRWSAFIKDHNVWVKDAAGGEKSVLSNDGTEEDGYGDRFAWSPDSQKLVVDTPIDDRNPALGQARDGTLVVGFCRTANYDDQGRYDPKLNKLEDTRFTLSRDGGKTWSESAEIRVAEFGWGSPFGKIVTLPDGAMLMPIYGGQRRSPGEKPSRELDHSYLYRSTDNGQTWAYFAEIGDGKPQLNETALPRLSSGKFLAAMRSGAGDLWLSESDDGARTWSRPKLVTN